MDFRFAGSRTQEVITSIHSVEDDSIPNWIAGFISSMSTDEYKRESEQEIGQWIVVAPGQRRDMLSWRSCA